MKKIVLLLAASLLASCGSQPALSSKTASLTEASHLAVEESTAVSSIDPSYHETHYSNYEGIINTTKDGDGNSGIAFTCTVNGYSIDYFLADGGLPLIFYSDGQTFAPISDLKEGEAATGYVSDGNWYPALSSFAPYQGAMSPVYEICTKITLKRPGPSASV